MKPVQAAYTWGAAGVVSERLGSSNVSLWYAFGPQGETRQLTNASGSVVDQYAYTAWGQPLSSSGSDANPFCFGGEWGYYTDAGFGATVLCGARWYDTTTQRWLTRDPIGYDGGDNLYAYCRNNPVGRIDPSGLAAIVNYPGAIPAGGPYYPGVPEHPVGANILDNIYSAYAKRNWPLYTRYAWFLSLVPTGMEWDYKRLGRNLPKIKRNYPDSVCPYDVIRENPYDAFGNFNYGAAAAALGLSESDAIAKADWAHYVASGPPTLSDHGDLWIMAGYTWYGQHFTGGLYH